MEALDLVVTGKWYDMIEAGIKKEEYRELKPFWVKRFCYWWKSEHDINCKRCSYLKCLQNGYVCYPFDVVHFHRGYTKTTCSFELETVFIGTGNEDWGAPKDEDVFILKLGKRI